MKYLSILLICGLCVSSANSLTATTTNVSDADAQAAIAIAIALNKNKVESVPQTPLSPSLSCRNGKNSVMEWRDTRPEYNDTDFRQNGYWYRDDATLGIPMWWRPIGGVANLVPTFPSQPCFN